MYSTSSHFDVKHASKHLQKLLQNINDLTVLAKSAWLTSCLVERTLQESPDLIKPEAVTAMLTQMLSKFEEKHPADAEILRRNYWGSLSRKELVVEAEIQGQSERTFYGRQKNAVEQFTVFLFEHEQRCKRHQETRAILQKLPTINYQQLFEIDRYLAPIEEFFKKNSTMVLSLKGIGGIGKTALAHHIAGEYVERNASVHQVLWVSAQQQYLTESGIKGYPTHIQLEQIFDEMGEQLSLPEVRRLELSQKVDCIASELRTRPYLVVLDNLETVEDFRSVIHWLAKLTCPTKFILTARESISSLDQIKQIDLNELSREASLQLIEHTAQDKNISINHPEAIYELVGGNPLAIILTVSLHGFMPAQQVLNSLRMGTTDDIYKFIYLEAWSLLPDKGKDMLLTLHRVNGHADWHWLEITTELSDSNLIETLQQLIALSLVQVQQDQRGNPMFSLHRLTSTFLQTEVLGWK